MRYCVIDFETTGLAPPQSEVIEFAAVRVQDGEIGLNLASLCRPVNSYISRKITEITGITSQMTAGCPSFEESLITLIDFIGSDTIVCHNAPFDMGFLNYYCHKAGLALENQTLCTLALARKLFPALPSRKLAAVAGHLGVKATGFHRAMADAMATAEILIKMTEITGRATVSC
ncbi:MAG: 3'-5' exonuclease [Oscillospiraceae bacterium]|nr:3'-5' exonuclease [Oscillospiraceae bacterium]